MGTIRKPNGRLIVTMPPRHGKSELCSKYLPAWYTGTFPNRRVILASYEADFAASWGRKAREVVREDGWRFGVNLADTPAAANNWEIAKHGGGMSTAGVGGPITGKGADLLIIDDAIKNAEEAASRRMRDKVWDWYRSTAYTRLEPGGSVVIFHTRWHGDDLIGRLLEGMEGSKDSWRLVNMPAETDGKALWPERYSIAELQEIKKNLGSYYYSALYLQDPQAEGGLIFQRPWLSQTVDAIPAGATRACRFWDKAGSSTDGDFSAGVLMVEHEDIYYVADVEHGRWSPLERNKVMLDVADRDHGRFRNFELWIEQEPGNGGKESAEISAQILAKYGPRFDKPHDNKVVRARPFAAQCEAKNVRLVKGPWNKQFIDELVAFDKGEHDDLVDGASGAFNKINQIPKRKGGVGIAGRRVAV